MKLVVHPTTFISGEVTAPASKSHSIRAIFLALLAQGESTLTDVLAADDITDAFNVCKNFSVEIAKDNNNYIINSKGIPLNTGSQIINTGNSGITTHFVMPLLGLRKNSQEPVTLTCNEQMRARPVAALVDALITLGLKITYLDKPGFLPLVVAGQLKGGTTEIAGMTSQYLSALLCALPCAANDSVVSVNNLRERPYLDMTVAWLKESGIQFSQTRRGNTDKFEINGNQVYKPFIKVISGDFSSAAYLIAAAAMLQSQVVIKKLDIDDAQADKELIFILQKMGADILVEPTQIIVRGGKPLTGLDIDASDFPDLLPTLAVIGSVALGKTRIFNVPQARIKETDRIHSIREGLTKMGCQVETTEDSITIYTSKLHGASVHGYGDHRTVMALCIAGLIAQGETIIEGAQAINKTYPAFIKTIKLLGANVEVDYAIVE